MGGHLERMGKRRGHIGFGLGNSRERDNLGDLGVDGE